MSSGPGSSPNNPRRKSLRFFKKTPHKPEEQESNVHELSLASPHEKFIGKFYSERQEMGYWTLALDVENTVGDICDLLADKTGVPRGSYYLLRRAKGKFGIRKDTQLSKDKVFSEIKKPDDCLFIVASNKQERRRLRQFQATPKDVQMPTAEENMITVTSAPFASQLTANRCATPNTDLIQKKMGRPRGLTRGFSAPGMTAENIQQMINSESPKTERMGSMEKNSPSRLQSSNLAVDPMGSSPTRKFGGKSPPGLVSSLLSSSMLRKTQSIDNFSPDGYMAENESFRHRDRTRSGSPKMSSPMKSSPSLQSVMKNSPSLQSIMKNSPPTPSIMRSSPSIQKVIPPPISLDSGPSTPRLAIAATPNTPRGSPGQSSQSSNTASPLTPRSSPGTIQRAQQPAPIAASEPHRRISRADSRSDDAITLQSLRGSPASSPSEGEETSRQNGGSIYNGRNALSAQTKNVRRRSSPGSKSPSSRLSVKEAMSMLRLYTQDDGDPEGPCFTIAITPITTSLEVRSVIESRLTVPESSMKICIAAKLSNSNDFHRMLKDDEYILEARDRWNDHHPLNPAFFYLLGDERVNLKDISMRPALFSPLVPTDKPAVVEGSTLRSTSEEKAYRRRSVPIFLGGTAVKDNSKDSTDSDSGDTPRHSMECDGLDSQSEPGTPNSNSAIWAPCGERLSLPPRLIVWISPNELQIVKKVGAGGFSKVYLGRYKNRQVAIKTLKGTSTEDQVESFKKEFDVLGLINNPHLIHFYGACIAENGQNDPTLSIILEYCSQGNLFEALNNKKLDIDWQTFFKWSHQALSGVLCLHSMTPPLVHRDLKSQNLLLDSNWNVKVADFGLSRTMTMTNAASLGMLRGTMAYCAPEIYNGQMFSEKSDVFSMGIVMWEMIERIMKGKYFRPYYDYPEINFDFQVIIQTARNGIRPTLDTAVPKSLREIVSMCWSSDPASRPACETVINAIQTIYAEYRADKQGWESLRRSKDE